MGVNSCDRCFFFRHNPSRRKTNAAVRHRAKMLLAVMTAFSPELSVEETVHKIVQTTHRITNVGCIRILGITTGTTASTYSPAQSVTREQMAAFLGRLWRALGNTCSTAPTTFTDIDGSFAEADVACIFHLGITTGTTSATYSPAEFVTREQMAAFIARFWEAAT